MLCELTIENVAVIERATVLFGEGFNVLTGETGAGKSILIDSINAILGNRASREIVRSGAEKAVIWASFSQLPQPIIEMIQDAGYECEGDLLLNREITAEGKSTCRINGRPATVSITRDICGQIINIHGQHDNQDLLNAAKHIRILDTFATNGVLLAEYKVAYAEMRATEKLLNESNIDEDEKLRRLDILQYQLDEIELANLEIGEDEALTAQKNLIRNAEKIINALSTTYAALNGSDEEGGAVDALASAASAIRAGAGVLEEAAEYEERINDIYYAAKDIAFEVNSTLSQLSFDTGALEEIEERLETIYKLKRKYGASIEEIIAFGDGVAKEISDITFADENVEQLTAQLALQKEHAQALATQLTATRITAFDALRARIEDSLAFLNMPGIVFTLKCEEAALGPLGQDEIEFYISTNPGEAPKPMARIASGGELSRIMLAIKNALANKDSVPILIYDEIDTGISGSAAGRVGQLLKDTANTHQVICVTHTGQIAACAHEHLHIEKNVQDGRTFTTVKTLSQEERINEIAYMLQGENVTPLALENAKQMLAAGANTALK